MDAVVLELLISCFQGKSLLQYTNLFFPKECKKNDKIILKIFSVMEICCYVCNKYRKFKNP